MPRLLGAGHNNIVNMIKVLWGDANTACWL